MAILYVDLVLSLFHYCNDLKFANTKQLVLF